METIQEYIERMIEIGNDPNPTIAEMTEYLRYRFDDEVDEIMLKIPEEKLEIIFKILKLKTQ